MYAMAAPPNAMAKNHMLDDDDSFSNSLGRFKNNHEPNKVKVRKYFPETWFWNDAVAG
jgi:hypothetical protein